MIIREVRLSFIYLSKLCFYANKLDNTSTIQSQLSPSDEVVVCRPGRDNHGHGSTYLP